MPITLNGTAGVTYPDNVLQTSGVPAPGTNGNVLTSNGTAWTSTAPSGGARGQTFTSNGTFTIPSGVTALKVTVVGGGGGTAGVTNSSANASSGGGGGGNAVSYLTGLTPGNTLAVTIGAAGTNVSTSSESTPGNTGGTSSVASGTQVITTISATGGLGGYYVRTTSPNGMFGTRGGAGGTATGGTINIVGNAGGTAFIGSIAEGCGQVNAFMGGQGGNSLVGYAGLPAFWSSRGVNTNAAASGFGCGASGLVTSIGGTYQSLGSAGAGVVIFEW